VTYTTTPLIQSSGCFQLVSSGASLPVGYPVYPTISFLDSQLIELTSYPYSYLKSSEFSENNDRCLERYSCPGEIVYLQLCCETGDPQIDYFGIEVPPNSVTIGEVYLVETVVFSGCATVVELSIKTSNLTVFFEGNYNIIKYDNCNICTESTISCYVTPTPTVTPTITLTTLKNECEPITLFPLGVSCISTNPTSSRGKDGTITLAISGGTPPYLITWNNGNLGPYITNLSEGYYTATVIDYYGDFTATTTCSIFAPRPETTTTTTTIQTPQIYNLCINNKNFGDDPDYKSPNGSVTFIHNGFVDGYANWVSDNGNFILFWNQELSSWQISGETLNDAGIIVSNPNPSYPPDSGWVTYGDNTPTTGRVGTCYQELICGQISGTCPSTGIFQTDFPLVQIGSLNNYPIWSSSLPCSVSGDWTIYYNSGTSRWETSGLTGVTGFVYESYNDDSPIGTWSNSGTVYTLNVVNKECNYTTPLSMTTRINQPVNGSDGNIVILANGGIPPYTYSNDDGVSYRNLPIFNNLIYGTYVTVTQDSSGNTVSDVVRLTPPAPATNYDISLNTVITTTVNTSNTLTRIYTSSVVVNPSIPSGVTITFNLSHLDDFRTSPLIGDATNINVTLLTKNSTTISANTTTNSTGTTFNTIRGCQLNDVYISATTEDWQNLTITYGDTINIVTTSTINKVSTSPCYIGTSTQTYTIYNSSISGCSLCTLSTS
jgi:hypothetical protein